MDARPPEGIVTFLLTDVEDSTRIWREVPDAAVRLARHAALIHEAVGAHRGVRPPDQGEGDSTLSVFASPADALAAAVAAQRALCAEPWPEGPSVRVRMALATGEAELRDGCHYGGLALIRAARLRTRARGGQILVSATTAALAGERLPAGVSFLDLGALALAGLERPEPALQLCHPDLPVIPPPAASGSPLPVWPTSLVGRTVERREVAELLSRERLVTLTGVGGSGKTRLAHAVADDLVARYADGVAWVELARLAADDQLAAAVLAACGAQEAPGVPPLRLLSRHLASRELLLVLDNCEHLLGAACELAEAVLAAAPAVRLLVTSREPLGAAGEVSWRVPSLSLPVDGEDDAARIGESEAVRLFVERAAAARREFALDAASAPLVARICRRLDGIPLALELAAARTRALSLRRLADGLDDRFRLLTGGRRSAVARQRTLLASVQWSHDLLDDDERLLFRRLSAFVAPFGLEAAEAVASDAQLDRLAVLDVLARLVDKSLVQHEGDRYRLLETLRQFAQDRADEAGELATLRDRHLAWCARRAADWRLDRELATHAVLDEVAAEAPDLVAALDWSTGRPAGPCVALLHPLEQLWASRHGYAEARAVVGRTLASLEVGSVPWLAVLAVTGRLLLLAGEHGWRETARRALGSPVEGLAPAAQAELETAIEAMPISGGPSPLAVFERMIASAREAGNRRIELGGTLHLAGLLVHVGDLRRARPLLAWLERHLPPDAALRFMVEILQQLLLAHGGDLQAARQLAELRLGRGAHPGFLVTAARIAFWTADEPLFARALRHVDAVAAPGSLAGSFAGSLLDEARGLAALMRGDLALAAACFERCWILTLGLGAQAFPLAEIALAQGDPDAAERHLAEVDARFGDAELRPAYRARTDVLRARRLRARAEIARAEAAACAGLAVAADQGLALVMGDALETLALLAADRGDTAVASRRLGAAEAFRARSGYRWRAPDLRDAIDALRPRLDPVPLAEGAALSLADAAAHALRGRGPRGRPDQGWDALTPTEQRVVELVADGLSNQEIAGALFVSVATVKSHLVHVFQKLAVRSRAELAVAATRRVGAP